MFKKIIAAALIAASMTGCMFVETGKVGLRKTFNNEIESTELLTGSMNQTVVGSVIEFPVREIPLEAKDMHPPAADNTPMGDFDVTVTYSINPAAVSDLYVNKSRDYHAVNSDGETLLMYSRLQTLVRNAAYKVTRNYDSLTMNDHRDDIEMKLAEQVRASLTAEKLDGKVIIGQVLVKSIEPPQAVKNAAIRLVAAKAENAAKDVEVETAKKEAERVQALSQNKGAIEYMDAQARLEIAMALREGKVNSVVVPYDFKGIVTAK